MDDKFGFLARGQRESGVFLMGLTRPLILQGLAASRGNSSRAATTAANSNNTLGRLASQWDSLSERRTRSTDILELWHNVGTGSTQALGGDFIDVVVAFVNLSNALCEQVATDVFV